MKLKIIKLLTKKPNKITFLFGSKDIMNYDVKFNFRLFEKVFVFLKKRGKKKNEKTSRK